MENGNAQKLAAQIAGLLQENANGSDDDFLRDGLEKINQRLDKIEAQIQTQDSKFKIPNLKPFHASQERFTNLAEIADEIINQLNNEKACPYEPTGKPCDNCSMCNSRGF